MPFKAIILGRNFTFFKLRICSPLDSHTEKRLVAAKGKEGGEGELGVWIVRCNYFI